MKTINELEQEAKQAREVAAMALSEVLPYGSGSGIADKLILAAVAMVTYQFALGMQEQEQGVPDDGWIRWRGGNQPTDDDTVVKVKLRNGEESCSDKAFNFYWKIHGATSDIIAYRIAK